MYTRFFGLNEKPFSITPDPRYLFMSERHSEALAHLIYGIDESGGFIQLTGEVGTGKTTLVRSLLLQLPDTADVALVLNPQLSRAEFLLAICEELGANVPDDTSSIKALTDSLNEYLLANHALGRRTVLIVDEAQNLRVEVLEQVRMLTNLETAKQKLLQIILIGQPELRQLLDRNDMRQLAQRITGRYHLEPLSQLEAREYIDHRLRVAGAPGPVFTENARSEICKRSRGVPRIINVIADRALLGAFSKDENPVSRRTVKRAASEVYDRGSSFPAWLSPINAGGIAAAALLLIAGLAWSGMQLVKGRDGPSPSVSQTIGETGESLPRGRSPVLDAPVERRRSDGDPQRTLNEVLTSNATWTGTDSAFETLFGLWDAVYENGPRRACDQAAAINLHCLFQRGSLAQVRSLDRPVILTLRDAGGMEHQVVMSGINDQVAVLEISNQEFQIGLDQLRESWYGDYLLLWRPQIGTVKSFYPGMRDEHVPWIRESLAAIQGSPVLPMESEFFDEQLETRVRDYQRGRRLNVDGLVGQQTQIAMNTDLGTKNIPRLALAD